MGKYEFRLPDIGEGVTEGEIVSWLVSPGDVVVEDQPMVEVMTDKATVTITSPRSGRIVETRGKVGGVVPVHSVLVVFDLDDRSAAASPAPPGAGAGAHDRPAAPSPSSGAGMRQSAAKTGPAEPAATAVGDIREDLPGMNLRAPVRPAWANGSAGAGAAAYFNEKPLATPATRKLARDLGVDLRRVPPTGPGGRVTKDDVRALEAPEAAELAPVTAPALSEVAPRRPAVAAERAAGAAAAPEPLDEALGRVAARPEGERGRGLPAAPGDERIPLRGVRKRIFEAMSRSKHTAAHFTFVEECDVSALKERRARLRPLAEKAGVKLTFLPFFVKAVVAALKKHPTLNSTFDEAAQEIVVRKSYHIGIASATEAGLIVPVVRDADRRSVLEIAQEIARLGEDTKAGRVKPEDLGGSTFTITSLGQQGGLFATPILNFPEVAILGIHQMKQKPVVRDGQIVIGEVMLLSLSFDHRIIDGHVGAAFAYEIIGYLEDPDRLFLEMS
ncbi:MULTISPECIES: dihydrolipoamide acetyltransferase family protein [Sorangium]|uniref:Dihydrolipoamide acetyltransferase component of pyruvate dehydrogenase complex n=1 Tax=Sorangium cellulosum TaxID=56 RepID=A0A4P2QJ60_SORCE|nr:MULTISPECIES: dihydrolipoamide acetyltransferase family protein [Sorangium]AUX29979.1 branched-chain alpha-keto acid dehydrogenase subunit E2 [Sorangium cellulosum]WCQ89368.1 Dihydrolipoyllysine-residue acetyltransferase component of pyruvate dehydrogenase complex [Sorangium sp. Soce836]